MVVVDGDLLCGWQGLFTLRLSGTIGLVWLCVEHGY
jgi:hypothetical protein